MDGKKSSPREYSSSEESTSSGEDSEVGVDQPGFVRTDRIAYNTGPEEDEEEEDDDENDDDDDDDDDDDEEEEEEEEDEEDDEGDGHAVKARNVEENLAPKSLQTKPYGDEDEDESEADRDMSSASSQGKSHQTADEFLAPRNVQNGNGKKAPLSEKSQTKHPPGDETPEKGKAEMVKRLRDEEAQEKFSSKKQKTGDSEKPSKSEPMPEKASKHKQTPLHMKKKSEELEKPKDTPSQKQPSQKLENVSAKKEADKSKDMKKSVKDQELNSVKEPPLHAKPRIWMVKDEMILSNEILNSIKRGDELPIKKGDGYWTLLAQNLEGKLAGEWSRDQLCEKVKRMRARYNGMAEKFKGVENPKFRNSPDRELFGVWDQIWGNHLGGGKADHGEEENKTSLSKPPVVSASVLSGRKTATKKENRVVHEELEKPKKEPEESDAAKHKQSKKESWDTDESDSEESDAETDLHTKVTERALDKNTSHVSHAVLPRESMVQVPEKMNSLQSFNDVQKLLQDQIEAALSSIQQCARQSVKEWQEKALAVVESTMKASGDQARQMNRLRTLPLVRGVELMDWQPCTDDAALQKQWHELRLKELDIYQQKLELMQRECQLKQDQLKLQLQKRSK